MVAAGLISAIGVVGAFTFNALTFVPLLLVLMLEIPSMKAPTRNEKTSILFELREGLEYVWTHPGTRRLTIMSVIFMFLSAPLQGLLSVFAQKVLHGGPTLFGSMLSAIGLGSIVGRFCFRSFPRTIPGITSFRWRC
jgi:hypothetical protein